MKWLYRVVVSAIVFILAVWYTLSHWINIPILFPILLLMFLAFIMAPSPFCRKLDEKRLKTCEKGCEQISVFLLSLIAVIAYSVLGFLGRLGYGDIIYEWKPWLINTIYVVLVEAVVFWNGIVRVYMRSQQLGVRWRVIGLVCGWIPVVNLIILGCILHLVEKEVSFENKKCIADKNRQNDFICKTKYPLLLVHGVFFRDFRYFNYWGRIPEELEQNGATIFYGNNQSAASVEDTAKEISERVQEIVKQTGCEKVNVIAHSKGGSDTRYALQDAEIRKHVASLTTINTPHRGCEFADYLLKKIPEKQKQRLADTYNKTLRKMGDTSPDFLAAVYDLTASACEKRNAILSDPDGVYCQSFGSTERLITGGRFPLNCTYYLVHHFDGANDGLVGEKSFEWGEQYQLMTTKGRRGISHGDMIDLNRENIDGFDVREFYVQLVNDLRKKGF